MAAHALRSSRRVGGGRSQRSFGAMNKIVCGNLVPPSKKAGSVHVEGETREERLARAKGYPYPRPASSFVFVSSRRAGAAVYTLPCAEWTSPDALAALRVTPATTTRGDNTPLPLGDVLRDAHGIDAAALLPRGTSWTPILAIGSNAGPSQLARKFPPELFPDGAVVPVVQAVLTGFDVSYAPLISSYGSATATLEACAGAAVQVFVTYLTPKLQQRMHETEGAYNLCRLDGIELHEGASLDSLLRHGRPPVRTLRSVYNYGHQLGTLHVPLLRGSSSNASSSNASSSDGGAPTTAAAAAEAAIHSSPIALAEIPAHNRTFLALTQVQMQRALKHALSEEEAGEEAGGGSNASPPPLRPVPVDDLLLQQHDSSGGGGSGGGDGAAQLDELHAWMLSHLECDDLRRARVARLAAAARPFSYPNHEVMMGIGDMFTRNVK